MPTNRDVRVSNRLRVARIPTDKWSGLDVMFQFMIFGFSTILILVSVTAVSLLEASIGIVAYFLLTECVFVGQFHLTSIEISESGVLFRYPFRSSRVAWPDLKPGKRSVGAGYFWMAGPRPPRQRLLALFRPERPQAMRTSYGVTPRQARAIVSSEWCPPWELSPEARKLIEL